MGCCCGSSAKTGKHISNSPDATTIKLALQDYLRLLLRDVKYNNGDTTKTIFLIQNTLKKISENFDNPKFKHLNKYNDFFMENLGKYNRGIHFMKLLGFQENAEGFHYPEHFTKERADYQLQIFNLAYQEILLLEY